MRFILIREIAISDIKKDNQVDFKDCLFSESLISGEFEYLNIKKWIRYAAVNYGHADQILKTKANIGLLCDKLKWENCRYIDCIFSFKTFFNAFLRLYFENGMPYYGEMMDNFDSLFCRDKLQEFQDKVGIAAEKFKEFLNQLNIFSMKTHTLGNYMPCPDSSYNHKKGNNEGPFQDRIDILYDAIVNSKHIEYIGDNTIKAWKAWFEKNQDSLYLSEILNARKELMKFTCPSEKKGRYTVFVMKGKEDIIAYTTYLRIVNELINNRTNMMIDKMNNDEKNP